MIVHLFNSSSISGPERLVLPALARFSDQFLIINLREDRIERLRESDPLEAYAASFKLAYRDIRVRSRWDRQAVRDLQQLLTQLKPDLVHSHAVKASVYLRLASRPSPARSYPILSTHHGVHGLPDFKTRVYEWLYRKCFLRFFDRILCVSSADFEFLLGSLADTSRLRLHLNGADARFVAINHRPQETQKVRALWLPREGDRDRLFLFGVIGRLSAEKDHARVFQVLSGLNRLPGDRNWKCLIFGLGALERSLRQQALALGLEHRVVWMGYRDSVGDELAGLDLLLSFSKAEGLPINLIEAGWAGTAVMATLVGGLQDLLPDDCYGLRVHPDEPASESAARLSTLVSGNSPKLAEWGKHFQERVMTEFSQEKWINRLLDIYSEFQVSLAAGSR